MPSSLIIVALAAAWLVVLVPMIARKRQEVARTTDSALAARVVRVGGTRDEGLEESAMSDNATPAKVADKISDDVDREETDRESAHVSADRDGADRADAGREDLVRVDADDIEDLDDIEDIDVAAADDAEFDDAELTDAELEDVDGAGRERYRSSAYETEEYAAVYETRRKSNRVDARYEADDHDTEFEADEFDSRLESAEFEEEPDEVEEFEPRPQRVRTPVAERGERRYRPGRGGFDPEVAEIAARAKYAFRQRVVLGLLIAAVLSVILAATVTTALWWLTGALGLGLVGYLGYLRRQVSIENEIRQRRAARLSGSRQFVHDEPRAEEAEFDMEPAEEDDYAEPETVAVRRPVRPHRSVARLHNPKAVVVDLEDEDPAFVELDDPGQLPYRRAVGE